MSVSLFLPTLSLRGQAKLIQSECPCCQLLPAQAYRNFSTSICSRYAHTSMNKLRCPVNIVTVSGSAPAFEQLFLLPAKAPRPRAHMLT